MIYLNVFLNPLNQFNIFFFHLISEKLSEHFHPALNAANSKHFAKIHTVWSLW